MCGVQRHISSLSIRTCCLVFQFLFKGCFCPKKSFRRDARYRVGFRAGGRAGGDWIMNKASRWAGTVSVFLELSARRDRRIKSRLRPRRAWLRSLSPEEVRVEASRHQVGASGMCRSARVALSLITALLTDSVPLT